jgi:flagellar hook assembly protein FlgD
VARTGAYSSIKDFTIDKTVFSPDDGSLAVINVDGYTFAWDGKNNQGAVVQNGLYYVKVETTDRFGYTHMQVKEVTVLTNGLTAELRIFNSAGEIVKIIPVEGLTDFGSKVLTVNPAPPEVFSPGQNTGLEGSVNYAELTYMGTTVQWDGTNENGTIVNNGVYVIQLVGIDGNGSKTVAQTDLTVMHSGYEVVNNVKIVPNPVNPLQTGSLVIRYDMMSNAKVTIKVYNVAGELVKTLEDYNAAGEVRWELNNKVSTGIYILVIYARTDTGMTKTIIEKLAVTYK